jgi:hypothetical protein
MKTGDRPNNEFQMTIPSMARRLVSPKSDEGGSEAKAAPARFPRGFSS